MTVAQIERWIIDANRLEGCERCALPADCARCQRFTCNRCERTVGWELGAADDAPGLCDECWKAVAA
jgi:hypothetical protein